MADLRFATTATIGGRLKWRFSNTTQITSASTMKPSVIGKAQSFGA